MGKRGYKDMLRLEDTVLIIVDVQDKLANVMYEKEVLFENLQKIIKGAQALEIPILWTEQNPDRLGQTIPEIACLLPNTEPMAKLSFSCARNEHFMQALKALKRKQVLIAGIETHICIYQTAVHLVHLGYEAQVVVDAIS